MVAIKENRGAFMQQKREELDKEKKKREQSKSKNSKR